MQNSRWKKVLIISAIGLVIAGAVATGRGLFRAETMDGRIMSLSDGFCVSGLLILSIAIMSLIAGEGLFDVMSYAVQKGLHHLIPGRAREDLGNYYDYKSSKKRTEKKHQFVSLFVGGLYLAVGIIFTCIWYSMQA